MRYTSTKAPAKAQCLLYSFFLCIVLLVSACGVNALASTSSSSALSDKPLGSGMNPEPGTNGVTPSKEQAVPTLPVYSASVTFASSIPFAQALRTITNLGLQTELLCAASWRLQMPGQVYMSYHAFAIAATVSSAPLWLARLQASPGVTQVQPLAAIPCPMERPDNHPPFLTQDQSGTYLRVTFASAGYDVALNTINDMGFRLANPCYEQARANSKEPAWTPMSQQTSYTQTHTLQIATTQYNATIWLSQLKATPGIKNIALLHHPTCP